MRRLILNWRAHYSMKQLLELLFNRNLTRCFLAVVLVQASAVAAVMAQTEKKQNLSFEDELVTGQTQKPDILLLLQKKNFNYNRLIKLRENFIPEMRRTSEDLQRNRGAN